MAQAAVADSPQQATSWLQDRSFESWREQFDTSGFLIFERVLPPDSLSSRKHSGPRTGVIVSLAARAYCPRCRRPGSSPARPPRR